VPFYESGYTAAQANYKGEIGENFYQTFLSTTGYRPLLYSCLCYDGMYLQGYALDLAV
jgi:hypothetical protein